MTAGFDFHPEAAIDLDEIAGMDGILRTIVKPPLQSTATGPADLLTIGRSAGRKPGVQGPKPCPTGLG